MAKISSQSYPTTNKIPMSGGTFHVTGSSLITTAYNDRFKTTYNPSIWTKATTGDVVFTESSTPFSVDAAAPDEGLGTYKLLHSKQILSNGTYAIRHSVKLDFNQSEVSSKLAYIKFFDGGRSITLSLAFTPQMGLHVEIKRVNSPSGTHTYYYEHPYNTLDILVVCENRHFHFYRNIGNGFEPLEHPEHPQHLSHNGNYNVEIGVTLDNPEQGVQQAVYTPTVFDIVPCVTGLPLIDGARVMSASYFSDSFASFTAVPGAPGDLPVSVSGVDAFIGLSETAGTLQVVDVRDRESSTSLLVSPVREFYTDAEPILDIPEYAEDSSVNAGDLICTPKYLCDGSDEDDTLVEMVFDKGGNTYSQSPNELPRFKYVSEGRSYGMNFSYDSLPYDPEFYFPNYRVHSIRTLPLKSGKKLYYGSLVPDSGSLDYPLFNIRIKMQKVVHESVSRRWVQLYRNENSALFSAYSVLDSASEVPSEVVLPAEIYGAYRLYSVGVRILSVELKRASAPDSDYKVVAQTHWAVQSSTASVSFVETNGINDAEYSNCLHFEVKDPVGRLFYVLHDPCTETYTKGTDSTDSVDLRTDSIGAAEIYDGRVSIFYQTYSTRDYTVPGGQESVKILAPSDISFKTLNQSSNGFLETFAGRLASTEFYGLYCFDVATDESNNLVVVFNRERFLDSSTHHNQSYTIQGGIIDPSFYDRNPSVKGAKESPFLESGFRCMTLPMSELIFDSSFSIGYKNIIRQSSTLVTLVTLRQLLRVASYDLGITLTQPDPYPPQPVDWAPFQVPTRAESGFLKLNYNSERDIFVLSIIENRRKIPFIMVGKGTNWKEIAIPAIKNLDAGSRSNLFNPEARRPDSFVNSSQKVSFSCYNISADFAIDGTIHCFVNQYSKKVNQPLASPSDLSANRLSDSCFIVIPTDIMQLERKLLIEKDENGNYKRSEIFKPLFRQFRFNFLRSYADNIRWTSSVKRDMNYMVNTIGGVPSYAMVRVSGYQCENQSVETDLEMFSPLLQSKTFESTAPTFANYPFYVMPNALNIINPGPYRIARELEADDGVGYELIRSGARFRSRISYYSSSPGTVRPDYFIKMKVISVQQRDGGTTKYVDACIKISSHEFRFIVNDENSPSTVYVFQGDMTKLYDFYIYINGTQVVFRVDELISINGGMGADRTTDKLNYSRKTVALHRDRMPVSSTTGSKKSLFEIVTGGGQILNNYYKLYEAGWAFSYFDSDTLAYGGPQNGRSTSIRATGIRDIAIKSEQTHSQILYPVKISGSERRSPVYHWPNGFTLDFKGDSAKTKDSLKVKRYTVNDVSIVRSEALYGSWRAVNDSESVYIWADSEDSGLDKFTAECFIVRGCNVPKVTLVGKNSEEENWIDIETLDLSLYLLPVEGYSETEEGRAAVGGFEFSDGKFSLSDCYFKSGDERSALVKRASGNTVALKLKDREAYTSDSASVFSSKGYKILARPASYRYLGIRLDPSPTYHGYFTLENFDFGLLRSIPLEFNHDKGGGLKLDLKVNSYTVHDEQDFYRSSRPGKSYEFRYNLTDGKTLMKVVSAIDTISLNRRPVWVIEGMNSSLEKFSLCFVDSVSAIEPIVEEGGDSYYNFSINLKSLDGE